MGKSLQKNFIQFMTNAARVQFSKRRICKAALSIVKRVKAMA